MDPRIADLKSTTFQGRRLTRRQIADIQETVALFPRNSRHELARTVCEHLDWRSAKGDYRLSACLAMLEALEGHGILTLPAKRQAMQRFAQKPVRAWTVLSDPQPAIADDLRELRPIRVETVASRDDEHLWNALVDRHHYLGLKKPFGAHLRQFVVDARGRRLGCLLFEDTTLNLPCRDTWIGWTDQQRHRTRHLALCNSRFLIFPWVRVRNLASMALALAVRQLPDEWQRLHGFRPVLVETFIDSDRYAGTCYRAAGWRQIGVTGKRSGKAQKQVLVRELDPRCRDILCQRQPAVPAPLPARDAIRSGDALDAPFLAMWTGIAEAATAVAERWDRKWRQRRRTIGTLLVMLFVLRLVAAPGRQGYRVTLSELWDQCRTLGIDLPKPTPVAASAMTQAREKIHEDAFRDLHREVLATIDRTHTLWRGHRLFAVDGTRLNLPKQLIARGYRVPSHTAAYPQGLVSCLFRLHDRIPCDFDLFRHENERRAALTHLHTLEPGDIVVYDRGYYSRHLLEEHIRRQLHAVFRIRARANTAFDRFIASQCDDRSVELQPTSTYPRKRTLRILKCPDSAWVLLTTLTDPHRYTPRSLADLYCGRWSIEELYKTSKQTLRIETFRGRSERAVKQELYAHFTLIALTRILANRCDAILAAEQPQRQPRRTNFTNNLRVVARTLEALFLEHAETVAQSVRRIMSSLADCLQRERPGRAYPRVSRKPIGKWKPPKPA